MQFCALFLRMSSYLASLDWDGNRQRMGLEGAVLAGEQAALEIMQEFMPKLERSSRNVK